MGPVGLVAVHIERNPLFSPVDEAEHLDYVQRISQLSVPRLGQDMLASTDRLWECTGRAAPGWAPDCARVPAALRNSRSAYSQYEAQQPPLYYAASAVMRWPFIHLLGMGVLAGTRITGAIWLAGGLLALWLAGTVIGLDWVVVGAAVLLLCVSPNVIYAASIVSNDAASVFAGGVVALLAVIGWRYPRRLPSWVFLLAGFLAAMLKALDALAVAAVAAMFLIGALADVLTATAGTITAPRGLVVRRTLGLCWPCAGAMLLGAAIGVIGWTAVYERLALVQHLSDLPVFMAMRHTFPHASVSELTGQAVRMLDPLTNAAVAGQFFQSSSSPIQPGTHLAMDLFGVEAELIRCTVLAAGLSIFITRRRDWPGWLGLVSLVVLFCGGCLLAIGTARVLGFHPSLPGRYGLSVAPLLMLALAGSLRRRSAAATVLWTFGSISAGLSVFFMYA